MNNNITLPQGDQNIEIYLIHIFNMLSSLVDLKLVENYPSLIEGIYDDFKFKELVEQKWGDDKISKETIKLGFEFHRAWMDYVDIKSYGDDFFVCYDPEWYAILESKLIPTLISFDRDLSKHNINKINCEGNVISRNKLPSEVNMNNRPSDEYLLWRVSNLYKLLKDNNIISSSNWRK